jgi:hypothetical protein
MITLVSVILYLALVAAVSIGMEHFAGPQDITPAKDRLTS